MKSVRKFAVSVFALALFLRAPGLFHAGALSVAPPTSASTNSSPAPSSKSSKPPQRKASSTKSSPKKTAATTTQKSTAHKTVAKKRRKPVSPRVRRARAAFVASANLRPMAQQLLQDRTPTAYAGVEVYARRHAKEDAGALAWLVIGYAHTLDHDYAKAIDPLNRAKAGASELSDYVAYYLGDAYVKTGHNAEALATLADFSTNFPDSLLIRDAQVDYASVLFDEGDRKSVV